MGCALLLCVKQNYITLKQYTEPVLTLSHSILAHDRRVGHYAEAVVSDL